MTDPGGGATPFRSWDAEDWATIRDLWLALVPTTEGVLPTFRDRPLTPQQGGWVFERWVLEAFRLSGAKAYPPFKNAMMASRRTKEEVDGLILDGWQGFLVEAKNEADGLGIDPIFRLHLMAEHRPVGTMGLLFSKSGFTGPAIELAERLRPIRVLLFERKDLDWAVDREGSMLDMVRRKWTLALRVGRPHVLVSEYSDLLGES